MDLSLLNSTRSPISLTMTLEHFFLMQTVTFIVEWIAIYVILVFTVDEPKQAKDAGETAQSRFWLSMMLAGIPNIITMLIAIVVFPVIG